MRVSLVEDSQEIRRRLRALLSGVPGATIVSEADRASQAIAQLPRCNPDLLILDLRLADGSGVEVLESLQGSVSPPRVIVLTNLTDTAYRERCAQLGVRHFLSKSREIETLSGLLATLAEELPDATFAD